MAITKQQQKIVSFIVLIVIAASFVYWQLNSTTAKTVAKPVVSYDGQLLDKFDGYQWQSVSKSLSNIVALSFDENGKYGAAISIEGALVTTNDGGRTWHNGSQVKLDENDLVTSIGVLSDGRLVVSAGVDESPYTAIYESKLNGKWLVSSDYSSGGISNISADGQWLVGGNGLLIHRDIENEKWIFNRLPGNRKLLLNAIAHNGNQIVTAGEQSLIAQSEDNGQSWFCEQPGSGGVTLYSVAFNSNVTLVGGAWGTLWRKTNDQWGTVKGLSPKQSIFTLYNAKESNEILAAGGTGETPFIIRTADNGLTWQSENISPAADGRVVSIARSKSGLFAATLDGQILFRVEKLTSN